MYEQLHTMSHPWRAKAVLSDSDQINVLPFEEASNCLFQIQPFGPRVYQMGSIVMALDSRLSVCPSVCPSFNILETTH